MHTWQEIVRKKLTGEHLENGGLSPAYCDDVIRELAARIAAAALPAIMIFGLCALAVPITFLIEHKSAALPAQQ